MRCWETVTSKRAQIPLPVLGQQPPTMYCFNLQVSSLPLHCPCFQTVTQHNGYWWAKTSVLAQPPQGCDDVGPWWPAVRADPLHPSAATWLWATSMSRVGQRPPHVWVRLSVFSGWVTALTAEVGSGPHASVRHPESGWVMLTSSSPLSFPIHPYDQSFQFANFGMDTWNGAFSESQHRQKIGLFVGLFFLIYK